MLAFSLFGSVCSPSTSPLSTPRCDGSNLVLQVKDNGLGTSTARLEKCEGFGLGDMRHRASAIDARFEIHTAAGHGAL
jgi:signal transduction histidine kinase